MPTEPYLKPALTYEEQLDKKLIARGLLVADRQRALKWLRRIGYYRLSGYLYPYRNSATDDTFRPGSSFDDAISVYKFDCHLRLLLLQAMDRIEIAIRASVTYHLAHALGPFGYMDSSNYVLQSQDDPKKGLDFDKFRVEVVEHERKSSKEKFVQHYRAKYTNAELPIWMLTEIIPFGTLSKMTQNLRDTSIQRNIARDFSLSQDQLISWIKCLYYVRNLCAHHSRLWNKTISLKPEQLPKWKVANVTRDRMYVVLLVIEKLMGQIAPRTRWKDRLMFHLLDNPQIRLINMGFPSNWLYIEPWKLSEIG